MIGFIHLMIMMITANVGVVCFELGGEKFLGLNVGIFQTYWGGELQKKLGKKYDQSYFSFKE
jgi:hypothetical protein